MSIVEKDPTTKNKIEIPKKYVAILKNDDYTTVDMVVLILQRVFGHNMEQAYTLAMETHNKGETIAGGPYQLDVCQTKCDEAIMMARKSEMPLILEPREA